MTQHWPDPTRPHPEALRLRKAAHWAGDASPHFAEMLTAAPGMALHWRQEAPRLEAKTTTGGALMVELTETHLTALRSERTHSATLILHLPRSCTAPQPERTTAHGNRRQTL